MDNITVKVDGKSLVITIPNIDADGPLSSSGKTKLIASTRGAIPVEYKRSGLKLALNLTVPA
jgi:hypothetical protein